MKRPAAVALLLSSVVACDDGAPPAAGTAGPVAESESTVVRLVGSGAFTPLAALFASAWASSHSVPRIVVEPSVGSTGGVRAAADGAVDLGLVARPLNERERNLGLALIPVARDAVVIAAHPSVAVDNVSSSELVDLFSGRYTSFPDGSPATAFLRDRDDTAHAALERFVPGLAAARESAYSAHRFRVLLHDDAMGESLSVTPGSVGVFSLGAMVAGHLRLKVIGLDGAKPSVEGMQDGSWKATRDLAFVARTDRLSKVRPFLAFVAGPQGAALARASGYLPTPSELP